MRALIRAGLCAAVLLAGFAWMVAETPSVEIDSKLLGGLDVTRYGVPVETDQTDNAQDP